MGVNIKSFLFPAKKGGKIKVFYLLFHTWSIVPSYTGELGYDGLSGTRKIGPSYAKSVICI